MRRLLLPRRTCVITRVPSRRVSRLSPGSFRVGGSRSVGFGVRHGVDRGRMGGGVESRRVRFLMQRRRVAGRGMRFRGGAAEETVKQSALGGRVMALF